MATGWDNGLCQDYSKGLARWFSSRLDARHTIRRWFGEQRISMTTPTKAAVLLAAIALSACLAGCLEPVAEVTNPEDAQSLVDHLTFVKHTKTGLCFGVATTSRVSTNASASMSVMLAPVDCNAVGLDK